MDHYIISSIFTIIMNTALSVFIFFRNPKNAVNRMYGLFTLSTAVWSFGFLKMITASNYDDGLFWARSLHFGAIFIPIFFFNFAITFLGYEKKMKNIIPFTYGIAFALLLISHSNLFVSGAPSKAGFQYFVGPGPLYHLFTLIFFACVVYTLYILYKAYNSFSGLRKIQTKYIFISYLIGYSGGGMAFLPLFDIPMPRFALYTISICMGIIAYAIVRYRLMDITLLARNTSIYLIYFAITSIIFIPLILMPVLFWGNSLLWLSGLFIAFLIVAAPLLQQGLNHEAQIKPIRKLIDWIDTKLFNSKYVYLNEFKKFWEKVGVVYTSSQLAWTLVPAITELMNLQNCSFFMFNRDKKSFFLLAQEGLGDNKDNQGLDVTLSPYDPLASYLKSEKRIVNYDELAATGQKDDVLADMNKLRAQTAVPLFVDRRLTAILVLGVKKSGDMIHQKDMDLLNELTSTAEKHLSHSVFLENSIFYSGSLAHDIRSPFKAGILYEYIEDIRSGLENPKNTKIAQESLIALESRIGKFHKMINMMVDIYQNLKRFVLGEFEPAPIDYRKMVQGIVADYRKRAQDKGIILEEQIENGIPNVFGEPIDVERIVSELLTNALKYTDKGYIRINIYQEKNQEEVLTCISDTGCGIPEDKLEFIFEPFARANTDDKKEGLGIGLASIRQLIEANAGRIWCESKEGQGSKFFFVLPAIQGKH